MVTHAHGWASSVTYISLAYHFVPLLLLSMHTRSRFTHQYMHYTHIYIRVLIRISWSSLIYSSFACHDWYLHLLHCISLYLCCLYTHAFVSHTNVFITQIYIYGFACAYPHPNWYIPRSHVIIDIFIFCISFGPSSITVYAHTLARHTGMHVARGVCVYNIVCVCITWCVCVSSMVCVCIVCTMQREWANRQQYKKEVIPINM